MVVSTYVRIPAQNCRYFLETRKFNGREQIVFLHKSLSWRLIGMAGNGIDSTKRPGAFYVLKNGITTH